MNVDLERMKNVDIRTVDRDSLVDIADVAVDTALPRRQRVEDYIRQIRNPYCFRCGGIVVKSTFADTGDTLEDRLEQCARRSG